MDYKFCDEKKMKLRKGNFCQKMGKIKKQEKMKLIKGSYKAKKCKINKKILKI